MESESISQVVTIPPGSIRVFTYVTAEKAPLYRAIMRVFMEARALLTFHLRPRQIRERIGAAVFPISVDQAEIDSALSQLSEWGNLEALPDTGDVATVEDFYKQRYIFQMTSEGEAAQRAIESSQGRSDHKGELRRTDLADIRNTLRDLTRLASAAERDPDEVYRLVLTLQARFESLVDGAQTFMSELQRKIDWQSIDDGDSITGKQRVIDYLQRFIGELVIATEDIVQAVRDIENAGIERLLQAAAERTVIDEMDPGPEKLNRAQRQWQSVWNRFRDWFISRPGCSSNSDVLRGQARESMPALLNIITCINDRLITRIDRSNDMRVLARWFMEAPSEADAHRLWRAAFGLGSSRHLLINDSTLDHHETQNVIPDTSWLDAPPLNLSSRLRGATSPWRGGRLTRIIDRTAEKEKLAAATHEEALRILRAQNRFVGGTRMRLSDLVQLETDEFDVLLEFLGEEIAGVDFNDDPTEILTSDGSFKVKLEPTRDGQIASIRTSDGMFSGPDHWITVERNVTEEVIP
jgi:uncharacterized protein (TIGR02677 family)